MWRSGGSRQQLVRTHLNKQARHGSYFGSISRKITIFALAKKKKKSETLSEKHLKQKGLEV
jgi:hypothetical protein